MILRANATKLPLADKSVDFVFGSPPYCDARTYGIGADRGCVEWVEWMLDVTAEAQRVCRGPVIWVAAGVTRKRNYWPACEGLMWEWWKRGGDCQLYRPVFWRAPSKTPGSGGKDWFRADVEYCMCFKRPGILAWSDNKAMGHRPRWAPGGEMSYRMSDGTRRNQWGGTESSNAGARRKNGARDKKWCPSHRKHTKRRSSGGMEGQRYRPPAISNPGNYFEAIVGGGVMGNRMCHENEAPFPERVAEWWIRSMCPPGGTVLDPFSGSGTTAAVAKSLGRKFVASDIRESQCNLTRRRVAEVQLVMM